MFHFIRAKIRVEDPTAFLQKNGFERFESVIEFRGGERIALQRGRTVTYLQVGDRSFYLKRNKFNWVEFIKTIVHLQRPARNAFGEWNNILAVKRIGIPTVSAIAMGEKRILGLELASFIITEELYGAESLEKIIDKELSGKLTQAKRRWKYSIISNVAQIAHSLHTNGMCHQDFYLGHFFLDAKNTLYLIDLQRVLHWKMVPKRYVIKDLGQLGYSADFTGHISRTDRMRFLLGYLGMESLGPAEKNMVRLITAKTERIAAHTVKLLRRRRRRREIQ